MPPHHHIHYSPYQYLSQLNAPSSSRHLPSFRVPSSHPSLSSKKMKTNILHRPTPPAPAAAPLSPPLFRASISLQLLRRTPSESFTPFIRPVLSNSSMMDDGQPPAGTPNQRVNLNRQHQTTSAPPSGPRWYHSLVTAGKDAAVARRRKLFYHFGDNGRDETSMSTDAHYFVVRLLALTSGRVSVMAYRGPATGQSRTQP